MMLGCCSASGQRPSSRVAVPQAIKVLLSAVLVCAILSLSALGSYLNHVRGDGAFIKGGYWYHHIMSRLAFAIPTGAVMALFACNWRPFPIVVVLTTCSLFIGWGCYFDVPFQKDGYKSRSGAFDWLLGRQEEGWTEEKVFFHNFAGMALRGLAWTAPQGYLLYHLGYGWHHSVSGCMMGLAYTLGYLMPPYKHIPTGTGWSELLWGYWIWVGVIVSGLAGWLEMMRETCGGGEGHTSRHTSAYLSSYIRKRWLAVAFEVWNALITVIFIFSTVYYALVQQNDVKNKGQTFFGMFVISFVMLAAQLVVLTSVWLTKKKDIDLTYELRAVAILCESPLILRNRVRFHFHHHPNMDEGEQFLTYSSAGQGHKNGNRYGSVDVPEHAHRDLGFESDASSQQGMNRRESKTPADLQNDTTQSDVSDSETEEVDLSRPLGALDEPGYGKHIRLWLRGVEYALWHVVEMCTLTSAPAVLRLVIGLLSLLGCLATACITTAIVVWNIHAPRFLIVCQCTQ